MEKSKKTLKMIGICIIGLVIVVAVNMLKKPEDPFKNDDRVKLGYQHVEESNILNSKDYDSYYVYFYETGNEKCQDTMKWLNLMLEENQVFMYSIWKKQKISRQEKILIIKM